VLLGAKGKQGYRGLNNNTELEHSVTAALLPFTAVTCQLQTTQTHPAPCPSPNEVTVEENQFGKLLSNPIYLFILNKVT